MKKKRSVFDRAKETKRQPISLYLDREIYDKFRKICEKKGAKASKVIEELLREAINEYKE